MQKLNNDNGLKSDAQMLDRLAMSVSATAARRPVVALSVLAVALVLALLAATRLGVDTDSSRMLNPSLPFQERAQAVNAAFPAVKNTAVVVLRGPHADAVEAATAALAERLTARDEAIASVFAPSADPFLLSHGLLYDDLAEVEAQLGRLSRASNLLAELRENQSVEGFLTAIDRALELAGQGGADAADLDGLLLEAAHSFDAASAGATRPLDWGRAVAEDTPQRLTRTISVLPVLDFTRLNPARPAIDAAREEIATLAPALSQLVEIGLTGDPVLRAEELKSVTATLPLSLGLSLLLVAVILFLSLGRVGRVGLALSAVLATLLLTTGFAALAVGSLNLISVAFVVLMVGLGIDFAIHLLAHLDEDSASGAGVSEALRKSTGSIGGALILSAATTCAAFLAFTTTDFIGMAQLGLIGAAGVALALLVSLTMIPAVVALRPSLAVGRGPLAPPRLGRGGARVGFWIALAIGGVACAFAPGARFDADPMGLRAAMAPGVVTYGWLSEEPTLAPLRLSLLAGTAEEAQAASTAAKELSGVRSAVWLGDLVPEDQLDKLDQIDLAYPSLQVAVEGTAPELAAPPEGPIEDRLAALGTAGGSALADAISAWRSAGNALSEPALGTALFRFFPSLIERIALQLEAGEITAETLPAGLRDRFVAGDGTLRVEIAPEANITEPAARGAFVATVLTALPNAGGPPAQVEGAAQTVARAMAGAAGIALAATAILAWAVLRRLILVAAILLPLALAAAVTLAASALLDIPFNYANVIVLPLMIGIGVDTGIHLAVRAARSDGTVFDTSTPRAALASALTTIAAFGTLALSDHRGTASMGVMLCIALTAGLLMIFAITPRLATLGRADRR
ncbi:MAG: efflux RND transporter permease subunit [Pseudomonadota bacterium]